MPEEIIIDLTKSDTARLMLEQVEIIQRNALNDIKNTILRNIADIEPFRKELDDHRSRSGELSAGRFYHPRLHNTICIAGERGSGKTTFIINLFNDIEKQRKGASERGFYDTKESNTKESNTKKPNLSGIEVLPIVDPTLMEDKEHILITIISSIQRRVENRNKEISETAYKHWETSLKKLAGGLHLLKSVGSDNLYGESWDDAQWALETGLKNARSGADLEVNIQRFISLSLDLLDAKAFLLAFDDIDTSFERGWPVLEIIRKYLTTPEFIVLLSGDFALYSKLVRRQQYLNLGSTLLDNDRPTRERHAEKDLPRWADDSLRTMVDRLEDQYLLKILQPQNRITLLNLDFYSRELCNSYTIKIRHNSQKTNPETSLTEYIDKMVTEHFHISFSQNLVNQFRSGILQQPTRTVLQILVAADKYDNTSNIHNTKRFLNTLTDIAASPLYHAHLNADIIKMGNSRVLLREIRKWLTNEQFWDSDIRLIPNFQHNERDLTAIVLGGALAYHIRIAPFVALQQLLTLNMIQKIIVTPWMRDCPIPERWQDLFDYIGLDVDHRFATGAARLINVLRTKRTSNIPFYGTIPVRSGSPRLNLVLNSLYGTGYKTPQEATTKFPEQVKSPEQAKSFNGQMKRWIEKVINKVPTNKPTAFKVAYNTCDSLAEICGHMGVFVNLLCSNMQDETGREMEYISVFNLLGALTDIMALAQRPQNDAPLSNKDIQELRLGGVRTYPRPPWTSREVAVGDTTEEANEPSSDPDISEDTVNKDVFDHLRRALGIWLKSVADYAQRDDAPSNNSYHPVVYSRISTRFFNTLINMDRDIPKNRNYTGYLLHRQIVAFLNAVLVEERLAGHDVEKIARSNPVNEDTNFLQNLGLSRNPSDHEYESAITLLPPYFRLIATCPLWILYIEPETTLKTFFTHLWAKSNYGQAPVAIITQNGGNFDNLFDPLNSIDVLGKSGGTPKATAGRTTKPPPPPSSTTTPRTATGRPRTRGGVVQSMPSTDTSSDGLTIKA